MAETCPDLEAKEPKIKNPLLAIYSVDREIKKEKFILTLITENQELKEYFTSHREQKIEDNIKIRTVMKRIYHNNRQASQRNVSVKS